MVQGRVYNLRKIFRRLNGLYFACQVRARLEWGRALHKRARRSREFGAYYYDSRLIRIHPVLDQPWVPIHVVESVLYHEMCHQVSGERMVGKRRIVHTPEFRRLEREYAFHAEASRWLKQHLKELLHPRPRPAGRVGSRRPSRQLTLRLGNKGPKTE